VSTLNEAFRLIGKQDFIFLDIGCHIGFVSSYVMKARTDAQVMAIDPDPRNIEKFKRINRNEMTSSNLEVKNIAIWEYDGFIPFGFENSNTANNRFNSESNVNIQCKKLESLLVSVEKRNILIKIDVQGYELEVLKGALGLLAKNNVLIILEFDESALQSRGSNSMDLLHNIHSIGYSAWDATNKKQYENTELADLLQRRACVDLLFLPGDTKDLRKSKKI
jgi:FkbM family methyltransferase